MLKDDHECAPKGNLLTCKIWEKHNKKETDVERCNEIDGRWGGKNH